MERKIGEIFEHKGEWFQCVEDTFPMCCGNCDFYNGGFKKCDDDTVGECIANHRNDMRSVCFKKLEKNGEPFERNGCLYQAYKVYEYPLLMNGSAKIPINNGFAVIIKQNQEDMEENKTSIHAEDTELARLVGRYVNYKIDYDTFENAVKELYSCRDKNNTGLLPFDLESAKQGKPVCTRDGRKARIICFDRKSKQTPIVALVEYHNAYDGESVSSYAANGIFGDKPGDNDLMMLPEKHEGWVNLYKERIYGTKEEAIAHKAPGTKYIDTIKVEWQE